MNKIVVLGVTGGIAAYKSLELVEKLVANRREVAVIMTPSATKIIGAREFEKRTGGRVYTELFREGFDYKEILKKRKVEHIDLAQSASVIVVAPATANVLAKFAGGIADDYLTTTILAATCPIIVCPSMNVYMWHHPATQKNIAILKSYGYHIIDPDRGMLACGYEGQGRLASIDTIEKEIETYLKRNASLEGKKILVTAGGTREAIDDIRFITNKSSGKMGAAIAEECFLRGADVTIVRSKNSVRPRYNFRELVFETADDLQTLLEREVKHADILFHIAAVSDFRVDKKQGKLKSNQPHTIRLIPRTKIIDSIKKKNPRLFLVAFKAEANVSQKQLINSAEAKRKESGADMVVANEVGQSDRGFESDNNEVFLVRKSGIVHIELAPKRIIAQKIIDAINNEIN